MNMLFGRCFCLIFLIIITTTEGIGVSGGRLTNFGPGQLGALYTKNSENNDEEVENVNKISKAKFDKNEMLSSPEWETVVDPNVYIVTEYENSDEARLQQLPHQQKSEKRSGGGEFYGQNYGNNYGNNYGKGRRNGVGAEGGSGHSLSIVNPLDVLRQRLLLEIARRRNLKQNQHQIIANAEILKNIG